MQHAQRNALVGALLTVSVHGINYMQRRSEAEYDSVS
jgi:hypothetical protein